MASAPEANGPVQFVEAYWAWLRGERDQPPDGGNFGIAPAQAAGLVRQIENTDAYRELPKRIQQRLKL